MTVQIYYNIIRSLMFIIASACTDVDLEPQNLALMPDVSDGDTV